MYRRARAEKYHGQLGRNAEAQVGGGERGRLGDVKERQKGQGKRRGRWERA